MSGKIKVLYQNFELLSNSHIPPKKLLKKLKSFLGAIGEETGSIGDGSQPEEKELAKELTKRSTDLCLRSHD